MPKRQKWTRRWTTAASWPAGVALTSWDYMWRTTPMRRHEAGAALPDPLPSLLEFPVGVGADDVQAESDGTGPLFHRSYSTRIRGSDASPDQLMKAVKTDLNQPAPTTFARFQRLDGEPGPIELGDEYVVRMPGPWD